MSSEGRRTILSVSLSPANADAVIVAQAMKVLPARQRSAALLGWAAAFLTGKANEQPELVPEFGMTEAELDSLLDDF